MAFLGPYDKLIRSRRSKRVFKQKPVEREEIEGLVSLFKSGTDWILHDAPALILFCADSAGGTSASINANLALHNAALAAEVYGLGCFYVYFIVVATERDDRIPRLVSLPETHAIFGALAVGYPRLTYKKWPERNPAKVTWIGADPL